MKTWSLQDAKARFSELVRICVAEGPQLVTRRGSSAVVVLPADEYRRLSQARGNLREFFLSAPRVELDISRSGDTGREVDL